MDESVESSWPFPQAGTGQTNVLVTAGGDRLDFTENTPEKCSLLLRYVFLASLGTALYAGTIAVDIWVALQDIDENNTPYAIINLAFVATPSVLFGLYMFCTSFVRHNGSKAFCNAILWLLAIPLIPLFPILRTTAHIHHALAATCSTDNQALHMSLLSKPSSTHLLKFLQALVASAPQLVVRLHKVLAVYDDDKTFENVGKMTSLEWAQVGLGSVAVVLTVSSAVGGSASTRSLLGGSLALENVAGGSVVLAVLWCFFFLAARIPVLSLLIHSFEYWSLVFLLLHCPLVMALQSNKRCQQAPRTFFVYLFSAFLFVFAYIEVNLTRRIQCRSACITHILFAALALLEQSAILVTWFLVERGIIPNISLVSADISYKNVTMGANGTYFGVIEHDEMILSVHYSLFSLSVIFMAITFCCRSKL